MQDIFLYLHAIVLDTCVLSRFFPGGEDVYSRGADVDRSGDETILWLETVKTGSTIRTLLQWENRSPKDWQVASSLVMVRVSPICSELFQAMNRQTLSKGVKPSCGESISLPENEKATVIIWWFNHGRFNNQLVKYKHPPHSIMIDWNGTYREHIFQKCT